MRVDKIIEIMEPTLLLDIVSIFKLGGGGALRIKNNFYLVVGV